jgi:hypothetical protein
MPAVAVRDRAIALYVLVAVSYGLDARTALAWLEKHDLTRGLAAGELTHLQGDHVAPAYRDAVEALWALCWTLSLVSDLNWGAACRDDFVHIFPDPRRDEDPAGFCPEPQLLPLGEILQAVDVGYLLHNCHVEARLTGSEPPTSVDETVLRNRRRALEWVLGGQPWHEIELDT